MKTLPSKPHKRQLSSNTTPKPTTTTTTTATPGSRQSKRIKASNETTTTPTTSGKIPTPAKKSKYFDDSDTDDKDDVDDEEDEEEEEASGYEDAIDASASSAAAPSLSSSPSSSVEDASDSDIAPKKKGRKALPKRANNERHTGKSSSTNAQSTTGGIIEKGKELWRQGIKAGLGPGKEVFIERPKPRGDGGVKYVPERIHPNTMAFLGDLKANNEREWLKCELKSSFFLEACLCGGLVGCEKAFGWVVLGSRIRGFRPGSKRKS